MPSIETGEYNSAAIAMPGSPGPALHMPSLEMLEYKNQWRTWAADVYIRLRVHGFQKYLFEEPGENAMSDELRDARYTAAYIFCHCATSVKKHIRGITSAKTIWDELRGIFEKKASSTHLSAADELNLMDNYCGLTRFPPMEAAEYCDLFQTFAEHCEQVKGAPSVTCSAMKPLYDLADRPELKESVTAKHEAWLDTGNPPVLTDLIADIKAHLDASTSTNN